MINRVVLFLSFWLLGTYAYGTHLRGGEITAVRRAGSSNTFDFTLTIYQDYTKGIEDLTNVLRFGDGSFQESARETPTIIPACSTTSKNIYRFSHTYGAPGQYIVSHSKQFRNCSVRNIGPSPCSVWFYVETMITIAPSIDQPPNHSPVLPYFAVDCAGIEQLYVQNPAAYDEDGDSLSYELIESKNYVEGTGGVAIPSYQYPNVSAGGQDSAKAAPAKLTIDAKKGLLIWDVPNQLGEYNVAFKVIEWRFGRIIGYVVRDMQIIVVDVLNKRPILHIPADTCVLAEDKLEKYIVGKDPNPGDFVAITASSSILLLNPLAVRATINPANSNSMDNLPIFQKNPAKTLFKWTPGCEQVRDQTYEITFKAQDQVNPPNSGVSLVDFKTWSIKVIGPPPVGLATQAGLGSIRLTWDSYTCSNIVYFNIYRRIDSSTYRPDTCTTGVPPPEGYTLIGATDGVQYSFLDDNAGQGLKRSVRYCYRITAVYAGPTPVESKESLQACAELKLDVPLITNVSVLKTDSTKGQIFVRWIRPRQIDIIKYPGPYRYVLRRSQAGSGIFSTVKSTTDLSDTTFTDGNINTDRVQYSYQAVFYFKDPLGGTFKDSAETADDILLTGSPTGKNISLTWSALVPWDNSPFTHFVYKKVNGTFTKIAEMPAGTTTYTDNGVPDPLVQGNSYSYYVVTRGRYTRTDLPDTLLNLSYQITVRLKDTVPPCPPQKVILTNQNLQCPACADIQKGNLFNKLQWSPPKRDSCAIDLIGYNVYFKPHIDGPFSMIAFTQDTVFQHNNDGSLAGCYRVYAVDSSGNESAVVDSVCNDNCVSVELPNIITPNGDTANEFWVPICITKNYVESADLKVYNRWGGLVYASTNRDIRWPNSSENPQTILAGTYYYYLRVKTIRLQSDNTYQSFKGWIEVAKKE